MIRPDPTRPGGLIWIASYPKSGSTWMRMAIAAVLEGGDLRDLAVVRKHGFGSAPRSTFEQVADVRLSDLLPDEIDELRAYAVRKIGTEADRPLIFKAHDQMQSRDGRQLWSLDGVLAVLHLVRDPRDVAVSMTHHFDTTIDQAIRNMADPEFELGSARKGITTHVPIRVGSWSDHCRSWMRVSAPKRLLLRFEDRTRDPVETLSRAVRAAGLATTPDIIARSVRLTTIERLRDLERTHGFDEKPRENRSAPFFREGTTGSWRKVLTRAQVARIESDHGEMMHHLGYL